MGSMVRTRTRFADNALPGADRAFIVPEESNWGNQDPSDVKYELENIASNTNNPGYDQIFSNFPKGSENGGNVGSGEDEQLRNPLSVCKINLEKC